MALADALSALLLVLVIFGGSTYLAAIPIRREVARAARRGEPLPRIVGWWQGVVRRAPWLLGAAGALLAAGAALWLAGARTQGGWAALIGLGVAGYLVQGLFLMRVVRQAARRAQQEMASAPPP